MGIRIFGVDPGSRLTGYGCVEILPDRRLRHVASGTLRLEGPGASSLESRLLKLFQDLTRLFEQHEPQWLVVERVFFAQNAMSALKLGQTRGAILVSGAHRGLQFAEYSPSEVKMQIAGHGQADKGLVAKMLRLQLSQLDGVKFETWDASDALGLACCHALTLLSAKNIARQEALVKKNQKGKRGRGLAEMLGLK